jgi:DNA-binding LacI/PurR family transcriptional regulator
MNRVPRRPKSTTGKNTPRPIKVGFLYWGYTHELESSYSSDLFFYLMERIEEQRWQVDILGADASVFYPAFEKVAAGKFDVLILNGIFDEPYIGKLCTLGVPMLALDYQPRGSAVDAVIFDGKQGGSVIAQALVSHKQPDVLFLSRFRKNVNLPADTDQWIEDDTAADRRMGMQAALLGTGIELWPMMRWVEGHGVDHVNLFAAAFKGLVENFGRAPSVIVSADMAIGNSAWREIEKLGYKVPQQIGFLSFDGRGNSDPQPEPGFHMLSSAQYDWIEMATRGWELLQRRMNARGTPQPPPELVRLSASFRDHGTLLRR